MAGVFNRVILASSLISFFWSASSAAQEAGTAVAVVHSATATGENGKRTLNAGMAVFIGELIKTGRTGQVQLIFTDDTKMVIGPNSSLVIETYLLRSKTIVNKFAVAALGGSFRFISGKSPKQAYSIKTPTATIGVRGTSLDLAVRRGTDVILFSGDVDFCGIRGCVRLTEACSLARAPRNGDVNLERSRERRNRQIRARFRFIVSQSRLRQDFRVSTRSCGDFQDSRLELRHEPPEPREPFEPPERSEPKEPPDPDGDEIG